MRILVDGDACPVKELVLKWAKQFDLDVHMFFDTAHVYSDDYSHVHILGKGADNVDFALLSHVKDNDIVITADYGLASLALTKNAHVVHPSGLIYTEDNILTLLNKRSSHRKLRKHVRIKGPSKRQKKDDHAFEQALKSVINKYK